MMMAAFVVYYALNPVGRARRQASSFDVGFDRSLR